MYYTLHIGWLIGLVIVLQLMGFAGGLYVATQMLDEHYLKQLRDIKSKMRVK